MCKTACAVAILALLPLPLLASSNVSPSYIRNYIENALPVGEGRMHYLVWDLYDAELYGPHGHWQVGQPLALSLTYLHDLESKKIVDKSIDLMKMQGLVDQVKIENWHDEMTAIFPDVQKGSNLTGVKTRQGVTIFYYDGKEVGQILDPEFGNSFFAIWLSPETTEPQLRSELLGMAN